MVLGLEHWQLPAAVVRVRTAEEAGNRTNRMAVRARPRGIQMVGRGAPTSVDGYAAGARTSEQLRCAKATAAGMRNQKAPALQMA